MYNLFNYFKFERQITNKQMKNIFNLNSKKDFFLKKKSRLFKIQPLIFLLNHLFFQSFLSMCYHNHCFSYQKSGISPDSSFHPGQPSHQPILSISLLNSSSLSTVKSSHYNFPMGYYVNVVFYLLYANLSYASPFSAQYCSKSYSFIFFFLRKKLLKINTAYKVWLFPTLQSHRFMIHIRTCGICTFVTCTPRCAGDLCISSSLSFEHSPCASLFPWLASSINVILQTSLS